MASCGIGVNIIGERQLDSQQPVTHSWNAILSVFEIDETWEQEVIKESSNNKTIGIWKGHSFTWKFGNCLNGALRWKLLDVQ